jgi:hypothetical protein
MWISSHPRLPATLAVLLCAWLATGIDQPSVCAYSVPRCDGSAGSVSTAEPVGRPTWCSCRDACGGPGGAYLVPCALGGLAGCISGAAARGGIGVGAAFEHTGAACGTLGNPCRIASLATDVDGPSTDLSVAQAECALVVDVRTAAAPAIDSNASRRDGLSRYVVPGVLCFDDAPRNCSVSVSIDVDGLRAVLCQPVGTCSTVVDVAGVAAGGLPWNPAASVAFGDVAGVGGRPLLPARLVSAWIALPSLNGSVHPPPVVAPGPSMCSAPAQDFTVDERARTQVVLAALRELGAGEISEGIEACGEAMEAVTAGTSGWQTPLLVALDGAITWADSAVPRTADEAVRYLGSEIGYFVLIVVAIFVAVALSIVGLALACRAVGRNRRRAVMYKRS